VGPVHFTDGFDRPDTIALGLDAPRLITVVVGALSVYAVMQTPLPMALRVGVAVLLALVSAVLGWARYAGRPVATWAWLAMRFALSPQSGGGVVQHVAAPVAVPVVAEASPEPAVAPVEDGVPVWARWLDFETEPAGVAPDTVEIARETPLVVVMDHAPGEPPPEADDAAGRVHDLAPEPTAAPGADVLQFPGARPHLAPPPESPPPAAPVPMADPPPAPVFVGAPRRITFFSLNGGSGRTTLATEVACVLAARGRHLAPDATVRPLDVALLDLDLRSATVAVRLGIPQPTLADYVTRGADPARLDDCMVRHHSGARALLGMPKPVASGPGALEPARVAEIVHHLERDGAHFVIIDVAADLGAVTTWVLSAVHDIFVVLTPTASGVQDAYRTTAALRRLGLGHKLRYVVNRARSNVDLDEVMGDLGGRIAAVIPDDPAVEDAENEHRITALEGTGGAAAALHDLAALLYPSLSAAPRRTRMSWLPWRRRAG
jgi:MinD-like ATPase involved in chromosome partitioning or flagellar assembly